ncbi:hypothetical protein HPP92_018541 [Vanilla planifolia]|uniref:Uncharacterized protein n=1 Tax=Vanilla planifolia TaxID=51239 RepID=A0A835QD64_VANPL|nr:hypothetical protein HPP92_018541 [Vanilla planifolia]
MVEGRRSDYVSEVEKAPKEQHHQEKRKCSAYFIALDREAAMFRKEIARALAITTFSECHLR